MNFTVFYLSFFKKGGGHNLPKTQSEVNIRSVVFVKELKGANNNHMFAIRIEQVIELS